MRVQKQRAARAARDLLRALNVTKVPVDVEEIAKKVGVDIRKAVHDTDLSGFLYRTEDQTFIGVNERHSPRRQRFTIAHELGHYLLHSLIGVRMDVAVQAKYRNARSSEGVDPEEIEANTFAAELLMPANLIEADMARISAVDILDDQEIHQMAEHYDVSVQALTIRLSNLGYIAN